MNKWHLKPSRTGHANIFDSYTHRLLARNIPEREAANLVAAHNQGVDSVEEDIKRMTGR